MDEKHILENDEQKKEDYRFVKEVIKKKTIHPKDILIRLGCIAGGAVLFGMIAAFVFARFLPIVQPEEPTMSPIDLGEDEPQTAATPIPAPTPGSGTPQSTESDAFPDTLKEEAAEGRQGTVPGAEIPDEQVQETSPVAAYGEMYGEMQVVAQEAMRCMVTVTGITHSEDWFNVQAESVKQASGVIVANNGQELYILTEYKTVDTVERVVVTFCDGSIVDGRYQMHDPNTGLTILKVALSDLEASAKDCLAVAKLGNSYSVAQGAAVIAIGSPMGYSNSVVYGQITSTTNTIATYDKQYNLFTTNILGNNVGSGVLINLDGEVISVIAQSFSDEQHENVIIGLPISQLKPLIEVLSNGGELPFTGIKGQSVTAEVMKQTGMPKGVYVSSLGSDSPALAAGIRNGDIITKYNGEAVEMVSQYTEKLTAAKVGETVRLTIMRKSTEGYREFEFEVIIGNR